MSYLSAGIFTHKLFEYFIGYENLFFFYFFCKHDIHELVSRYYRHSNLYI